MCNNVDVLIAKPVDVQAMINLFIAQSGVNHKIDELLLIKIAEGLEEGSQINQMIEKDSGKSKYSAEAMKSSIEEREREMREIGDKSNQIISEREELLSRLGNNPNRRH